MVGKFERGEAETLERELVELLNNRKPIHPHRCVEKLYKEIIKSYMNTYIKEAIFIGRTYDEPGDIKLISSEGKTIYIELKLVEKGKGTRANISQDALTKLGLIYNPSGPTISWSQFRKKNNFDKRVLDELERFKAYPPSVRRKEEKARYLRDKLIRPSPGSPVDKRAHELLSSSRDPKERLAAEIVLNILKIARDDKISYLKYLKGLHQDSENIKKFAILLLLGFHKMNALKKGFENFDKVIASLNSGNFNFRTYYVIKESCEVILEDLSCWIPKLLQANFKIEFPEGETNVTIGYSDVNGDGYKPILRVVFHWKNVFQGIQTPCLNVFDEGILKDYLICS
ncbi:MAG: hypothetical protein QXU30_04330 [Sulfolobales archaeon]